MLTLSVERFGDMSVIVCDGRIVQPEAAFRLRNTVIAEAESRLLVLDLSEVEVIEGGGLGMLAYLQLWAFAHEVQLKLFNPSHSVLDRIEHASLHPWQIATLEELTALLMTEDHHLQLAG